MTGDDLDEEYLTQFAHDQQHRPLVAQPSDACAKCPHEFHGLPCTWRRAGGPCTCPSSFEAAS